MGIDTNSKVEDLQNVADGEGGMAPPAARDEQEKTNDRLGNRDTLDSVEHVTDSTDPEPFSEQPVPEGVTPLVVAATGNADTVFVGTEDHQPVPLASAKDSFSAAVRDLSEIYVRAVESGDTVFALWERDN